VQPGNVFYLHMPKLQVPVLLREAVCETELPSMHSKQGVRRICKLSCKGVAQTQCMACIEWE
jgi:hypothetical protein